MTNEERVASDCFVRIHLCR